MPEHSNQSLPSLTLFLAQSATHVGDDEQLMRQAALAEHAVANFPPPRFSGEHNGRNLRPVRLEATGESQLARGATRHAHRRLIEQAFTGAIDEAQAVRAVEREYGDVDLFHHFAQQGRSFESSEPLLAQRLAERVHFAQDFAKNIVTAGAARADREITFAQRGQQIRKRAHRKGDALLGTEGKAQPRDDDNHRQRPLFFGREIAEPQQQQSDERTHAARREGQQEDTPLVWKRLQRLYFCRRR